MLSDVIKDTSLCGLGQSSPNPVLSTILNFEDEYLAHVQDGKCPAGQCKSLLRYDIVEELCTGCTLCFRNCPVGAITGERRVAHFIDQALCIKCGVCFEKCKFNAITLN
jgi:NADP-reducing hydrogenase subunit HndC